MRKNRVGLTIALIIVVVSLALMIITLILPIEKRVMHPLLFFVYSLSIGFGVMSLCYGIIRKSPVPFFLATLPLLITLTISLIVFAKLIWWAILVSDVVLLFVVMLISLILNGNRTEQIALNTDPNYKTFKEKEAEKEQLKKDDANNE